MLFGKKQNPKPPEPQRPPVRKTVEDSRFAMKMPSEWTENASYLIEGPEEDGIKHNIMVKIEDNVEVLDIATISQQKIQDLSKALQAYQELNQGFVQLNDSLPAYEVQYKWLPAGKREVYQRMMFVLVQQSVFTLTATFSEKTYKQFGPQVDSIFKSFKAM